MIEMSQKSLRAIFITAHHRKDDELTQDLSMYLVETD